MKESSIVFDYTDAEKMFGNMIAKELAKHIEISVGNSYPLHMVFGHTYLEIKPANLKKVKYYALEFSSLPSFKE